MRIVREICKVIMFTQLWATPLVIAKMFDSPHYLWLLALSLIGTILLFSHYEDIDEQALTNKVITKVATDMATKLKKVEDANN